MSQFPNGLRRRRWRRERGAAGTRRPGRGGAGGDTAPLPPHLRAAPRQGPAHGGRSERGCTPLPSPAPLAPLSPRRGEAVRQPRAGILSLAMAGCAAAGVSVRVLGGMHVHLQDSPSA